MTPLNNSTVWPKLLNIYENCTAVGRSMRIDRIVKDFHDLSLTCRATLCEKICVYKDIEISRLNLQLCEREIGSPYELGDLAKAIEEVAYCTFDLMNLEQRDFIKYKWNERIHNASFKDSTWREEYAKSLLSSLAELQIQPVDPFLQFKEHLDLWVWEGEKIETEGRPEAASRILEFISNESLTELNLSDLGLTHLPEIFDLFPFRMRLETLNLISNCLTDLPLEIENLAALKDLDLSDNQLECLPDTVGNLKELKLLDLTLNELTTLPDTIGNLKELQVLDIADNELTALPDTIGDLEALQSLFISSNPITGLPRQIFNLPGGCTVDVSNCEFSEAVLQRILEETSREGYAGPAISYSILEPRNQEERSIEDVLQELYGAVNETVIIPENLMRNPTVSENLRSWLSRLSWTADFQKDEESKGAFAKRIIEYLELANTSPQFRERFEVIIDGASETCGDRVTLSILRLGIEYRLATLDRKDMPALAHLLTRGVWALDMLERIAREKVLTLRFFDEIEVYLGYPIQLKERLELPIDVEEMLYFSCSALKEEDLREAENYVINQHKDENAYYNFLIKNEDWVKALKANFSAEFLAIEKLREEMSLNGNWQEAAYLYESKLKELSKSVCR